VVSGTSHYDPVAAAKDKADFLLTFTGVQTKVQVCGCLDSIRTAVRLFVIRMVINTL